MKQGSPSSASPSPKQNFDQHKANEMINSSKQQHGFRPFNINNGNSTNENVLPAWVPVSVVDALTLMNNSNNNNKATLSFGSYSKIHRKENQNLHLNLTSTGLTTEESISLIKQLRQSLEPWREHKVNWLDALIESAFFEPPPQPQENGDNYSRSNNSNLASSQGNQKLNVFAASGTRRASTVFGVSLHNNSNNNNNNDFSSGASGGSTPSQQQQKRQQNHQLVKRQSIYASAQTVPMGNTMSSSFNNNNSNRRRSISPGTLGNNDNNPTKNTETIFAASGRGFAPSTNSGSASLNFASGGGVGTRPLLKNRARFGFPGMTLLREGSLVDPCFAHHGIALFQCIRLGCSDDLFFAMWGLMNYSTSSPTNNNNINNRSFNNNSSNINTMQDPTVVGFNPNVRDYSQHSQTLLMEAAKFGRVNVVRQLLECRTVEIKLGDCFGHSVLQYALRSCFNSGVFGKGKPLSDGLTLPLSTTPLNNTLAALQSLMTQYGSSNANNSNISFSSNTSSSQQMSSALKSSNVNARQLLQQQQITHFFATVHHFHHACSVADMKRHLTQHGVQQQLLLHQRGGAATNRNMDSQQESQMLSPPTGNLNNNSAAYSNSSSAVASPTTPTIRRVSIVLSASSAAEQNSHHTFPPNNNSIANTSVPSLHNNNNENENNNIHFNANTHVQQQQQALMTPLQRIARSDPSLACVVILLEHPTAATTLWGMVGGTTQIRHQKPRRRDLLLLGKLQKQYVQHYQNLLKKLKRSASTIATNNNNNRPEISSSSVVSKHQQHRPSLFVYSDILEQKKKNDKNQEGEEKEKDGNGDDEDDNDDDNNNNNSNSNSSSSKSFNVNTSTKHAAVENYRAFAESASNNTSLSPTDAAQNKASAIKNKNGNDNDSNKSSSQQSSPRQTPSMTFSAVRRSSGTSLGEKKVSFVSELTMSKGDDLSNNNNNNDADAKVNPRRTCQRRQRPLFINVDDDDHQSNQDDDFQSTPQLLRKNSSNTKKSDPFDDALIRFENYDNDSSGKLGLSGSIMNGDDDDSDNDKSHNNKSQFARKNSTSSLTSLGNKKNSGNSKLTKKQRYPSFSDRQAQLQDFKRMSIAAHMHQSKMKMFQKGGSGSGVFGSGSAQTSGIFASGSKNSFQQSKNHNTGSSLSSTPVAANNLSHSKLLFLGSSDVLPPLEEGTANAENHQHAPKSNKQHHNHHKLMMLLVRAANDNNFALHKSIASAAAASKQKEYDLHISTPLVMALRAGVDIGALALLQAKAAPPVGALQFLLGENDETLLHVAVAGNCLASLEWMIEHFDAPYSLRQDRLGQTALDIAALCSCDSAKVTALFAPISAQQKLVVSTANNNTNSAQAQNFLRNKTSLAKDFSQMMPKQQQQQQMMTMKTNRFLSNPLSSQFPGKTPSTYVKLTFLLPDMSNILMSRPSLGSTSIFSTLSGSSSSSPSSTHQNFGFADLALHPNLSTALLCRYGFQRLLLDDLRLSVFARQAQFPNNQLFRSNIDSSETRTDSSFASGGRQKPEHYNFDLLPQEALLQTFVLQNLLSFLQEVRSKSSKNQKMNDDDSSNEHENNASAGSMNYRSAHSLSHRALSVFSPNKNQQNLINALLNHSHYQSSANNGDGNMLSADDHSMSSSHQITSSALYTQFSVFSQTASAFHQVLGVSNSAEPFATPQQVHDFLASASAMLTFGVGFSSAMRTQQNASVAAKLIQQSISTSFYSAAHPHRITNSRNSNHNNQSDEYADDEATHQQNGGDTSYFGVGRFAEKNAGHPGGGGDRKINDFLSHTVGFSSTKSPSPNALLNACEISTAIEPFRTIDERAVAAAIQGKDIELLSLLKVGETDHKRIIITNLPSNTPNHQRALNMLAQDIKSAMKNFSVDLSSFEFIGRPTDVSIDNNNNGIFAGGNERSQYYNNNNNQQSQQQAQNAREGIYSSDNLNSATQQGDVTKGLGFSARMTLLDHVSVRNALKAEIFVMKSRVKVHRDLPQGPRYSFPPPAESLVRNSPLSFLFAQLEKEKQQQQTPNMKKNSHNLEQSENNNDNSTSNSTGLLKDRRSRMLLAAGEQVSVRPEEIQSGTKKSSSSLSSSPTTMIRENLLQLICANGLVRSLKFIIDTHSPVSTGCLSPAVYDMICTDRNRYGMTAVHCAVLNGQREILSLLLRAQVSFELPDLIHNLVPFSLFPSPVSIFWCKLCTPASVLPTDFQDTSLSYHKALSNADVDEENENNHSKSMEGLDQSKELQILASSPNTKLYKSFMEQSAKFQKSGLISKESVLALMRKRRAAGAGSRFFSHIDEGDDDDEEESSGGGDDDDDTTSNSSTSSSASSNAFATNVHDRKTEKVEKSRNDFDANSATSSAALHTKSIMKSNNNGLSKTALLNFSDSAGMHSSDALSADQQTQQQQQQPNHHHLSRQQSIRRLERAASALQPRFASATSFRKDPRSQQMQESIFFAASHRNSVVSQQNPNPLLSRMMSRSKFTDDTTSQQGVSRIPSSVFWGQRGAGFLQRDEEPDWNREEDEENVYLARTTVEDYPLLAVCRLLDEGNPTWALRRMRELASGDLGNRPSLALAAIVNESCADCEKLMRNWAFRRKAQVKDAIKSMLDSFSKTLMSQTFPVQNAKDVENSTVTVSSREDVKFALRFVDSGAGRRLWTASVEKLVDEHGILALAVLGNISSVGLSVDYKTDKMPSQVAQSTVELATFDWNNSSEDDLLRNATPSHHDHDHEDGNNQDSAKRADSKNASFRRRNSNNTNASEPRSNQPTMPRSRSLSMQETVFDHANNNNNDETEAGKSLERKRSTVLSNFMQKNQQLAPSFKFSFDPQEFSSGLTLETKTSTSPNSRSTSIANMLVLDSDENNARRSRRPSEFMKNDALLVLLRKRDDAAPTLTRVFETLEKLKDLAYEEKRKEERRVVIEEKRQAALSQGLKEADVVDLLREEGFWDSSSSSDEDDADNESDAGEAKTNSNENFDQEKFLRQSLVNVNQKPMNALHAVYLAASSPKKSSKRKQDGINKQRKTSGATDDSASSSAPTSSHSTLARLRSEQNGESDPDPMVYLRQHLDQLTQNDRFSLVPLFSKGHFEHQDPNIKLVIPLRVLARKFGSPIQSPPMNSVLEDCFCLRSASFLCEQVCTAIHELDKKLSLGLSTNSTTTACSSSTASIISRGPLYRKLHPAATSPKAAPTAAQELRTKYVQEQRIIIASNCNFGVSPIMCSLDQQLTKAFFSSPSSNNNNNQQQLTNEEKRNLVGIWLVELRNALQSVLLTDHDGLAYLERLLKVVNILRSDISILEKKHAANSSYDKQIQRLHRKHGREFLFQSSDGDEINHNNNNNNNSKSLFQPQIYTSRYINNPSTTHFIFIGTQHTIPVRSGKDRISILIVATEDDVAAIVKRTLQERPIGSQIPTLIDDDDADVNNNKTEGFAYTFAVCEETGCLFQLPTFRESVFKQTALSTRFENLKSPSQTANKSCSIASAFWNKMVKRDPRNVGYFAVLSEDDERKEAKAKFPGEFVSVSCAAKTIRSVLGPLPPAAKLAKLIRGSFILRGDSERRLSDGLLRSVPSFILHQQKRDQALQIQQQQQRDKNRASSSTGTFLPRKFSDNSNSTSMLLSNDKLLQQASTAAGDNVTPRMPPLVTKIPMSSTGARHRRKSSLVAFFGAHQHQHQNSSIEVSSSKTKQMLLSPPEHPVGRDETLSPGYRSNSTHRKSSTSSSSPVQFVLSNINTEKSNGTTERVSSSQANEVAKTPVVVSVQKVLDWKKHQPSRLHSDKRLLRVIRHAIIRFHPDKDVVARVIEKQNKDKENKSSRSVSPTKMTTKKNKRLAKTSPSPKKDKEIAANNTTARIPPPSTSPNNNTRPFSPPPMASPRKVSSSSRQSGGTTSGSISSPSQSSSQPPQNRSNNNNNNNNRNRRTSSPNTSSIREQTHSFKKHQRQERKRLRALEKQRDTIDDVLEEQGMQIRNFILTIETLGNILLKKQEQQEENHQEENEENQFLIQVDLPKLPYHDLLALGIIKPPTLKISTSRGDHHQRPRSTSSTSHQNSSKKSANDDVSNNNKKHVRHTSSSGLQVQQTFGEFIPDANDEDIREECHDDENHKNNLKMNHVSNGNKTALRIVLPTEKQQGLSKVGSVAWTRHQSMRLGTLTSAVLGRHGFISNLVNSNATNVSEARNTPSNQLFSSHQNSSNNNNLPRVPSSHHTSSMNASITAAFQNQQPGDVRRTSITSSGGVGGGNSTSQHPMNSVQSNNQNVTTSQPTPVESTHGFMVRQQSSLAMTNNNTNNGISAGLAGVPPHSPTSPAAGGGNYGSGTNFFKPVHLTRERVTIQTMRQHQMLARAQSLYYFNRSVTQQLEQETNIVNRPSPFAKHDSSSMSERSSSVPNAFANADHQNSSSGAIPRISSSFEKNPSKVTPPTSFYQKQVLSGLERTLTALNVATIARQMASAEAATTSLLHQQQQQQMLQQNSNNNNNNKTSNSQLNALRNNNMNKPPAKTSPTELPSHHNASSFNFFVNHQHGESLQQYNARLNAFMFQFDNANNNNSNIGTDDPNSLSKVPFQREIGAQVAVGSIAEYYCFVDVKSLFELRFVCKSWKKAIDEVGISILLCAMRSWVVEVAAPVEYSMRRLRMSCRIPHAPQTSPKVSPDQNRKNNSDNNTHDNSPHIFANNNSSSLQSGDFFLSNVNSCHPQNQYLPSILMSMNNNNNSLGTSQLHQTAEQITTPTFANFSFINSNNNSMAGAPPGFSNNNSISTRRRRSTLLRYVFPSSLEERKLISYENVQQEIDEQEHQKQHHHEQQQQNEQGRRSSTTLADSRRVSIHQHQNQQQQHHVHQQMEFSSNPSVTWTEQGNDQNIISPTNNTTNTSISNTNVNNNNSHSNATMMAAAANAITATRRSRKDSAVSFLQNNSFGAAPQNYTNNGSLVHPTNTNIANVPSDSVLSTSMRRQSETGNNVIAETDHQSNIAAHPHRQRQSSTFFLPTNFDLSQVSRSDNPRHRRASTTIPITINKKQITSGSGTTASSPRHTPRNVPSYKNSDANKVLLPAAISSSSSTSQSPKMMHLLSGKPPRENPSPTNHFYSSQQHQRQISSGDPFMRNAPSSNDLYSQNQQYPAGVMHQQQTSNNNNNNMNKLLSTVPSSSALMISRSPSAKLVGGKKSSLQSDGLARLDSIPQNSSHDPTRYGSAHNFASFILRSRQVLSEHDEKQNSKLDLASFLRHRQERKEEKQRTKSFMLLHQSRRSSIINSNLSAKHDFQNQIVAVLPRELRVPIGQLHAVATILQVSSSSAASSFQSRGFASANGGKDLNSLDLTIFRFLSNPMKFVQELASVRGVRETIAVCLACMPALDQEEGRFAKMRQEKYTNWRNAKEKKRQERKEAKRIKKAASQQNEETTETTREDATQSDILSHALNAVSEMDKTAKNNAAGASADVSPEKQQQQQTQRPLLPSHLTPQPVLAIVVSNKTEQEPFHEVTSSPVRRRSTNPFGKALLASDPVLVGAFAGEDTMCMIEEMDEDSRKKLMDGLAMTNANNNNSTNTTNPSITSSKSNETNRTPNNTSSLQNLSNNNSQTSNKNQNAFLEVPVKNSSGSLASTNRSQQQQHVGNNNDVRDNSNRKNSGSEPNSSFNQSRNNNNNNSVNIEHVSRILTRANEKVNWTILPKYIMVATQFQTMYFRTMLSVENLLKSSEMNNLQSKQKTSENKK